MLIVVHVKGLMTWGALFKGAFIVDVLLRVMDLVLYWYQYLIAVGLDFKLQDIGFFSSFGIVTDY